MRPIPKPPTNARLRPAYDAGRSARAEGMEYVEVHPHVVKTYRTRERRRAFISGWTDEDHQAYWDNLPTCSRCHQPVAPPESEEARALLSEDDPWHPLYGLEMPQ